MKYLFNKLEIKKIIFWLISIILITVHSVVHAGPPFLTDDPEPIDYKHWEFYLFSILDKNNVALLEPDLFGPAVEINWGSLPDVHLHASIPYAWSLPNAAPAAHGLGDIELGIKYRFIHETKKIPEVGIFPLIELPTGNANQNLGNGILWAKLPIWAQKSWGKWTTYGGGGYAINSVPGMLNYFFAGWLLQRTLNDHLLLGAEIFYQDALSVNSSTSTILNVGGNYNFNKNFALLFSAGHNITGQENTVGYLGLYWTSGL
jgi:hypothetical protein